VHLGPHLTAEFWFLKSSLRRCKKSPLVITLLLSRIVGKLDAAYYYRRNILVCMTVCVSVCLLVTFVSPSKMAEPIEMPFGG